MKVYTGERTMDGIQVLADGAPLDPRLDLKTFSRNGFEWSYEGAEPRQLALALLAYRLRDDARAVEFSERFMRAVVANLANAWRLTSDDIDGALAALE